MSTTAEQLAAATAELTAAAAAYRDLAEALEIQASEAAAGVVRFATDAEVLAGTAERLAVSPSRLGGRLAQLLVRAFYVNAAGGSNANPGTLAAPFATLDKAIEATPDGGGAVINLLSDVAWNNRRYVRLRNFFIRSVTPAGSVIGAARRVITVAAAAAASDVPEPSIAGLEYESGGAISFSNVEIRLPQAGAVGWADPYRALLRSQALLSIHTQDCTLVGLAAAAGREACITNVTGARMISSIGNTLTNMGGRWVTGVAAGTDPQTFSRIIVCTPGINE